MRHNAGEVQVLESAVIRTRREGIVYASTRVSPRVFVEGYIVPIQNNVVMPNFCGEGGGAVEQPPRPNSMNLCTFRETYQFLRPDKAAGFCQLQYAHESCQSA